MARERTFNVTNDPWRPKVEAHLAETGEIILHTAGRAETAGLHSRLTLWVLDGDAIRSVALPPSFNSLLQRALRIQRSQVPVFSSRDWPELEAACELSANFLPTDFVLEPKPPKFVLSLAGGIAQLSGTLQCRYGQRMLTPVVTSGDEMLWMPDPKDIRRYSMRDLGAEQEALERMHRSGFNGPDAQGRLSLNGEQRGRHVLRAGVPAEASASGM